MRERTQVLIAGGGPAGTTAATLLAQQGIDVVLLERTRFPRYHIGESLLPSLLPILDIMGARERVESHGFIRKSGAFYGWSGQEWALNFDDPGRPATHSFQVIRSEFDHLLLDHARHQGADVREETQVRHIAMPKDRATSASWTGRDGRTGQIDFTHLIDATGRAGILAARHLHTRRVHDVFRNVAAWGYWRGTTPLPDAPAGAIGVFSLPEAGWLWAIPLHDGTLSVGLVTDKRSFNHAKNRRGSIEAVYEEALARCPLLARMLDGAQRVSALKTEADYSYTSEAFCGPGYYLAGDAACFLDPLLSTGVHLAMYSGLLSAAAIATVVRGETDEETARRFYQTTYQNAYERLLILVGAFYRIHDGRDAYFRKAQTLSHRDQQGLRLHESFLNIITGAEDLHDAQHHTLDSLYDTLRNPLPGHQANGLGGHGTSHMLPLPTTPDHAAAGLYLSLTPHPTLRPTP
ncbi:tryptophan 7-halogenase [Streptomyces sp. ASQP_92]|uniref:NAD(P)/FAD-dependent oxidoreductase n=1 Tax=Streptomyces sp. ASQP_92 TaxID=2979116 RepID=UPI0021C1E826|nr:NAD(P)/FAD-dependent oxidoreductase [Streptomyces sp. ASQP_92]MCT9094082.1 tryptophan 7-halogenase [Streptomyces sp. ASQP_92]